MLALAVPPPNRRAPMSTATRLGALTGRTFSSVLPHLADRNGAPSASKATVMTSRYATGRRITLCARRAQAPGASARSPGAAAERPLPPVSYTHLRAHETRHDL